MIPACDECQCPSQTIQSLLPPGGKRRRRFHLENFQQQPTLNFHWFGQEVERAQARAQTPGPTFSHAVNKPRAQSKLGRNFKGSAKVFSGLGFRPKSKYWQNVALKTKYSCLLAGACPTPAKLYSQLRFTCSFPDLGASKQVTQINV